MRSLILFSWALLAIFTALAAPPVLAVELFVAANARPWDPAVNASFAFGSGTPDAPVIAEASLVGFAPGDLLEIKVLSGTVSAFPPGFPLIDAAGQIVTTGTDPNAYNGPINGAAGDSGKFFPSLYTPADWDTHLMALMGTFANSSGVIVGTPFEVGPSRVLAVPAGATRLQLGLNDDVFGDNGGGFQVNVAIVPEPGAWALTAAGLLLLIGLIGRRASVRANS